MRTVGTLMEEFHIRAVLPGWEMGVVLADHLWEAVQLSQLNLSNDMMTSQLSDVSATLRGNRASTADCRRDKFAQQETLRNAGVRHIDEIMTRDVEEAVKWCRERNYLNTCGAQNRPVILKPS